MATETELRALIAAGREDVLSTIKRNGLPRLSNVLYVPDPVDTAEDGPWNSAS